MTTRQTTALLLLIVASATLLVACTPRDALPGQIVFTRRDGDVNVLYKANASGSGEELLYRNEDATNANILNPAWVPGGRAVTFTAMRDGTWRQMEIDLATHEVKVAEGVPDLVSRPSRADDLVVERGSVFVTEPDGKRKQLYYHKNYDGKFNVGASEASWGPDRKYVIFQVCTTVRGCRVTIAPTDGSGAVAVTKGTRPAWIGPILTPAPKDT